MIRLFEQLCLVLAAYRWGQWRNWRRYYSTILFMIIGEMIYFIVAYNYPLWEQVSPITNITFNHLTMDLIVFPAIGILFFSNYPETHKRFKKVLYLFFWIVGMSVLEFVMYRLGYYKYSNGWNIWYSAAFEVIIFPLALIHQKYPPLAWISAIVLGTVISLYFKIPISSMK